MSAAEIEAIGPSVASRYFLLRPTAAFSSPPMCSVADLRTVLTIDDLLDLHEALDVREALEDRSAEEAARQRNGR